MWRDKDTAAGILFHIGLFPARRRCCVPSRPSLFFSIFVKYNILYLFCIFLKIIGLEAWRGCISAVWLIVHPGAKWQILDHMGNSPGFPGKKPL